MIDPHTQKPIQAKAPDPEYPYFVAPVSRLDEIRRLLDDHKFKYQTDPFYISLQGGPHVCYISFRHGTDADFVQQVLDSVE